MLNVKIQGKLLILNGFYPNRQEYITDIALMLLQWRVFTKTQHRNAKGYLATVLAAILASLMGRRSSILTIDSLIRVK